MQVWKGETSIKTYNNNESDEHNRFERPYYDINGVNL